MTPDRAGGWHGDLAALAGLASRRVCPHHDDGRVLVKAQVHVQSARASDTRRRVLSMILKAHASRVAGRALHQGGRLFRSEIVGALLDLSWHPIASEGIFATCGASMPMGNAFPQG